MTPEEAATWDVDPDLWPHTPPLHVFRALMDADGNTWWRAGSGHGLNAYDAAVEAIEEVEALCDRWDTLSRGESPTTAAIRACLRPGLPSTR